MATTKKKYANYKANNTRMKNKIKKLTRHLSRKFAFKIAGEEKRVKMRQHINDSCAAKAVMKIGTINFPNNVAAIASSF